MSNVFQMLVSDMRTAQKEYFATPRTHYSIKAKVLDRSKRLERMVDDHLALMDHVNSNSNQLDLYNEAQKAKTT